MQKPFTVYGLKPKIVTNTVHHCIVGPRGSGLTTLAHTLTLDIVKQLEGDLMFFYSPAHKEENVLQTEQQLLLKNILSIETHFQKKRVKEILGGTNLCQDTAKICAEYTGITFQSDKKESEIFLSGPQVLRYIHFGVDPDQFCMQSWAPFKPVIIVQEGEYLLHCWNKEQIDYLYSQTSPFTMQHTPRFFKQMAGKPHKIKFDKMNPLKKPVFY
jgi:hypothetical protein